MLRRLTDHSVTTTTNTTIRFDLTRFHCIELKKKGGQHNP